MHITVVKGNQDSEINSCYFLSLHIYALIMDCCICVVYITRYGTSLWGVCNEVFSWMAEIRFSKLESKVDTDELIVQATCNVITNLFPCFINGGCLFQHGVLTMQIKIDLSEHIYKHVTQCVYTGSYI